jgi:toxin ParE1/3/4
MVALVEALARHPYLGRVGLSEGVRELIVGGTPYIVVYRVGAEKVTILTVRHAARQTPT